MAIQILQGSVFDVLPTLPADWFHCAVTSPPYWALRSYLKPGDPLKALELGSEPTPEAHVAAMVRVFDEVRRVLRPDGLLWVNYGDTLLSGNGMPNCKDLLQPSLKSGVLLRSCGYSLALSAKGDDVLFDDQGAPNPELVCLLGVKRIFVKERNNGFRKIFNGVAAIKKLVLARGLLFDFTDDAKTELVVDVPERLFIVASQAELDSKPSLKLADNSAASLATRDDEASLTVKQSREPIAESIGYCESDRQTLSLNAGTEGILNGNAVQLSVAFPQSFDLLAGECGDFFVTKASQEQVAFSAVNGLINVRCEVVGHLYTPCVDGVIPYAQLYTNAIQSVNRMRAGNKAMIPEKFAIAMQEAGWILRDTIIWHKKSAMPASISGTRWERCKVKVANGQIKRGGADTDGMFAHQAMNKAAELGLTAQWQDCPGCPKCVDNGGYVLRRGSWRTTTAHEYIFMFAKSADYFADQEGVKEKCAGYERKGGTATLHQMATGKRNPRSVMHFAQEPLKAAHYAAYPTGLPAWFIKASTSPKGCCRVCGAPWARVVGEKTVTNIRGNSMKASADGHGVDESVGWDKEPSAVVSQDTLGFRPTCTCPAAEPVATRVLDPFGGSGSTAIAAAKLGCDCTLVELNPDYIKIARKRLDESVGLFAADNS